MRLSLPLAVSRRRLAVGLACSLLLHVALVALGFWARSSPPLVVVKRGEPLFVELPPEVPEEPAPLGNPASPPGAVIAATPKPSAPKAEPPKAKPTPKVETVRPAAPRRTPPSPEPARVPEPSQVAQAAPSPAPESPEPAPPAKAAPEPTPPAPEVLGPKMVLSPPESGRVASLPPESDRGVPGDWGGLRRGRGGIEGEPIPLNTPDLRYTDYFEKVRQRIKANWIYPREAGERNIGGQLVIDFAIAKSGHLQAVELERSSGVSVLDLYALNAVKLAQPFPPVPDLVAKGTLPIRGTFTYQIVDSSLLNQYLR